MKKTTTDALWAEPNWAPGIAADVVLIISTFAIVFPLHPR